MSTIYVSPKQSARVIPVETDDQENADQDQSMLVQQTVNLLKDTEDVIFI